MACAAQGGRFTRILAIFSCVVVMILSCKLPFKKVDVLFCALSWKPRKEIKRHFCPSWRTPFAGAISALAAMRDIPTALSPQRLDALAQIFHDSSELHILPHQFPEPRPLLGNTSLSNESNAPNERFEEAKYGVHNGCNFRNWIRSSK